MTRRTAAETHAPARWVAVTVTEPAADDPIEGVVAILPGSPPKRTHLTAGPCPPTMRSR